MTTAEAAPIVETPVVAPAVAPVIESKHTDPFVGRESDEVEEFDSKDADRGDAVVEPSTAEANAAAEAVAKAAADQAAEEQAAADKVAADKAAADKAAAPPADKAAADKAAADKAAADKAAEHAETRIPKTRFDEVNNKRKTAEAENVRLKAELEAKNNPAPAATAFDFDGKEEAYMKAVLDGQTKEAQAIRAEIRAAEKAEYVATVETVATKRATETHALTTAQQKTEAVVAELQGRFEVFDESSDRYSEEMVNDTIAMQRGFIEAGLAPDAALRKAAGLMTQGETDRKAAAPVVEAPAAPAVTPKKPNIAAKVAAANAQPPVLRAGESGAARDGSVSVIDMEEVEFDSLPESTKRRLRGD